MDNLSAKAPHKLETYSWKWNVDESCQLAFAFDHHFVYARQEYHESGFQVFEELF